MNTPLFEATPHGWGRLLVKDESRQASGAFKFRGTSNKVSKLLPGGVLVAASTGNHAAALALAGARRDCEVVIFVPEGTPKVKVDRITASGGTIHLVAGDYHACDLVARDFARGYGRQYVPSFDDWDIIAGHRSLFREVTARPDVAYVPVGGGGLIAAAILEWGLAGTRIIGVEHEAAPAMKLSLARGRRVLLDAVGGPAEGLLVRQVGVRPFVTCARYGLEVVTVDDAQLAFAIRRLYRDLGIRAEYAGAAAFAAATQIDSATCSGSTAVCIVSGGNIDSDKWAACLGSDPLAVA